MEQNSRSCNGLERLFSQCNIRFAVAFSFPSVSITRAKRCLAYALLSSPGGHVVLSQDLSSIVLCRTETSNLDLCSAPFDVLTDFQLKQVESNSDADISDYLEHELAQTKPPDGAGGMVCLYILFHRPK